jgi:hypothetical protein
MGKKLQIVFCVAASIGSGKNYTINDGAAIEDILQLVRSLGRIGLTFCTLKDSFGGNVWHLDGVQPPLARL